MDWAEGKDLGISPEEGVPRAEEAPLWNKLPENEQQCALLTDGSCRLVGKHRTWTMAEIQIWAGPAMDYITLPQSRQGKRHVLTVVEATPGWRETYPVPHATARITLLGLEKQVLWRHGTPERTESDNGTHF